MMSFGESFVNAFLSVVNNAMTQRQKNEEIELQRAMLQGNLSMQEKALELQKLQITLDDAIKRAGLDIQREGLDIQRRGLDLQEQNNLLTFGLEREKLAQNAALTEMQMGSNERIANLQVQGTLANTKLQGEYQMLAAQFQALAAASQAKAGKPVSVKFNSGNAEYELNGEEGMAGLPYFGASLQNMLDAKLTGNTEEYNKLFPAVSSMAKEIYGVNIDREDPIKSLASAGIVRQVKTENPKKLYLKNMSEPLYSAIEEIENANKAGISLSALASSKLGIGGPVKTLKDAAKVMDLPFPDNLDPQGIQTLARTMKGILQEQNIAPKTSGPRSDVSVAESYGVISGFGTLPSGTPKTGLAEGSGLGLPSASPARADKDAMKEIDKFKFEPIGADVVKRVPGVRSLFIGGF